MKDLYSKIKNVGKGAFLIGSLCTSIGLTSCSSGVDRPIYSTEINGKKVTVYDVNDGIFTNRGVLNGTKFVISDESGNIEKILYDDKTGKLGDEGYDYVEIHLEDGKTIKYTINYYINEEGQRINFNSDIGNELESITKTKFEEYNKLYQEIKEKISESLKEVL